jgi:hypothetical protein
MLTPGILETDDVPLGACAAFTGLGCACGTFEVGPCGICPSGPLGAASACGAVLIGAEGCARFVAFFSAFIVGLAATGTVETWLATAT